MEFILIIAPSIIDMETLTTYVKLMQEMNPRPNETQFIMVIGEDMDWHIKTAHDNEILFEKWKEMYKELNKNE